MLSRPIHLGWTQGSKSNRTWGNRGKGGRDDEEGGGDMRESNQEDLDTEDRDGERSTGTLGASVSA